MFESISVIGERGQITIPKIIREREKLRAGEKVIVKMEDNKIVVEKAFDRKEKEKLMAEGYKKMAKLNHAISEEFACAEAEVDAVLNDS